MVLFHAGVINDNRAAASEYACGVEVVVCASSRAEAAAALRKRGFGAVRTRSLRRVEPSDLDFDDGPLPTVRPGEIWARTASVPGDWVRRS